jgi:glycosyltransferase involved in cell wall biosynthesis
LAIILVVDASVVIITKNQKNYLQKTLPILLGQDFEGGFEIIVVDSGSKDGAREYVESLGVRLVNYEGEFNYARAFNLGASKAKGKFIVRLSGDVIPLKKDFLKQITRPFRDSEVGGTYGRYTISGGKGYGYPDYWPAWRFPKKEKKYHIRSVFLMGVPGIGGLRVYDFAGGCCAVRREIWEKRGFNERLIAGEDAEYAWFLHLIGYDIVCNPKAVVLHEHKINRSKTARAYLGLNKWNLIFNWEILKYWIGRVSSKDPYQEMH